VLDWIERGGPIITTAPDKMGFGTDLTQRTVAGQFGGALTREWNAEGLKVAMSLPKAKLSH
jgi:two-component sensor histidine kinase